MVTFIAERIKEATNKTLAEGQDKYRAYFVKLKLYEKYRLDVEAILIQDGYSESIVKTPY